MHKEVRTMRQNQQNSKTQSIILTYKSSKNFLVTAVNIKTHTHTHIFKPFHFLNGLPETRTKIKGNGSD